MWHNQVDWHLFDESRGTKRERLMPFCLVSSRRYSGFRFWPSICLKCLRIIIEIGFLSEFEKITRKEEGRGEKKKEPSQKLILKKKSERMARPYNCKKVELELRCKRK